MKDSDITPVKQIAAILCQREEDFTKALPLLGRSFSSVEYVGEFLDFVATDYYEPEMGVGLKRGMIAFKDLIHPGELTASKLMARDLENQFRRDGKRRINIDIGYLDLFKVVLASFKGRSNKIYLDKGIWADMILYFENAQYQTFMWGFPDFKSGIYNDDLIQIRSMYKKQIREK